MRMCAPRSAPFSCESLSADPDLAEARRSSLTPSPAPPAKCTRTCNTLHASRSCRMATHAQTSHFRLHTSKSCLCAIPRVSASCSLCSPAIFGSEVCVCVHLCAARTPSQPTLTQICTHCRQSAPSREHRVSSSTCVCPHVHMRHVYTRVPTRAHVYTRVLTVGNQLSLSYEQLYMYMYMSPRPHACTCVHMCAHCRQSALSLV